LGHTKEGGSIMTDEYLIKRIIALALKIKETESLSKATDELKQWN